MCAEAFRTFFKHQLKAKPHEKRDKARKELKAWLAARKRVLARDQYRCRMCAKSEPSLDVHHVKARSAGGQDVDSNLVALCRLCHSDVTLHKVWIDGTDANKRLRFRRVV